MFILTNLLVAMAQVLDYVLWAYIWILIARFIISFMNVEYNNPIVRFVYGATEPVLEGVRKRLPVLAGGFDFSPVVVWIVIVFLQRFLVRSLYDLALALRPGG
jgi:YggT family protein